MLLALANSDSCGQPSTGFKRMGHLQGPRYVCLVSLHLHLNRHSTPYFFSCRGHRRRPHTVKHWSHNLGDSLLAGGK